MPGIVVAGLGRFNRVPFTCPDGVSPMTSKTKLMLWLGAVGIAFTAAEISTLLVSRDWAPVVGLSAMFTFMAFAFESAHLASLSAPGFVAMIVVINYVRLHPTDPVGAGALILAVALNLMLLWMKRRGRHGPSHA